MGHDDYKEMIPAHALSALDASDERALNEHLATCAECRRDVAEWEATAASLALSVKPMEPSPRVRERILTQIRSDKSVSNVVPFPGAQRNLWNSLGSLGSIAAIILFAALIISVVALWQQNRSLRQQNEFYQLLTEPGSRVAELAGTAEATSATAKLAYNKNGRAILIANGLPRAPQGKQYQLWFIVGNKPPLPGKSFSPDDTGSSTTQDQVPETARNSAVFAVTLEPAGGVNSPTGAIYLRGEL
ncbi:MAG TPA: anti-sigma factor [Pyrinomonadaceae bacterium]|nr:anti-sigma factor [Pyrinomonadaceae bacterium]